jgi:hypothetical protein
MRVVLDVSKPLVPGFHLPHPRLPSLGIKFLYERLADYCTLCGLMGHCKSFCPAPTQPGPHDMYGVSLCSYVYPGTRSPPSSRLVRIPGDHRSLLCTEDLGSGFFLLAPLVGPTTTMQPPRCSPLKLVEEASSTPGFHPHVREQGQHDTGLSPHSSMSLQPNLDTSAKGKGKLTLSGSAVGYYSRPGLLKPSNWSSTFISQL